MITELRECNWTAMKYIEVETSAHSQMIDITERVNRVIPADIVEGVCLIFSMHTTAGMMLNENTDPAVCSDMIGYLERQVPWDDSEFRHLEGNSAAHIKAALTGFSLLMPIKDGKLSLGVWQGVYFCEFDGPRTRKVSVSFLYSNTQ